MHVFLRLELKRKHHHPTVRHNCATRVTPLCCRWCLLQCTTVMFTEGFQRRHTSTALRTNARQYRPLEQGCMRIRRRASTSRRGRCRSSSARAPTHRCAPTRNAIHEHSCPSQAAVLHFYETMILRLSLFA
eukprot:4726410-Pleurochrysis_carterae.AAC.1